MIDGIVEFYRKNQHGDMLFFKRGGFWSAPWTIAPHQPENALSIAKQYVAMQSDGLRHAERVVLEFGDGSREDAVAITDLPIGRQTVVALSSGEEKQLRSPVQTETLAALAFAIHALCRLDSEADDELL